MKYNIFVVKWPLSIQYLNMGIEYKIIVMGVNGYGFINRYFIFILVLVILHYLHIKAPNGMRAMGALANATIATFLVEAFNKYVGGEVFGIKFLEELGDAAEV